MMPQHMIHWFEIPTSNYQRAISFYEQLLSVALKPETMQGVEMAVFPYADQGDSGAPDGPVVGTVEVLLADQADDPIQGIVLQQ